MSVCLCLSVRVLEPKKSIVVYIKRKLLARKHWQKDALFKKKNGKENGMPTIKKVTIEKWWFFVVFSSRPKWNYELEYIIYAVVVRVGDP